MNPFPLPYALTQKQLANAAALQIETGKRTAKTSSALVAIDRASRVNKVYRDHRGLTCHRPCTTAYQSASIDITARTDTQDVDPARFVIKLENHSPSAHTQAKTGAAPSTSISTARVVGKLG